MDENLDEQIRLAKKRAEEYNNTLNEARKRDFESINFLENQKKLWAESFEEKNAMIEQLERELTSAVDELKYLKQDEKDSPFNVPFHDPEPSIGEPVIEHLYDKSSPYSTTPLSRSREFASRFGDNNSIPSSPITKKTENSLPRQRVSIDNLNYGSDIQPSVFLLPKEQELVNQLANKLNDPEKDELKKTIAELNNKLSNKNEELSLLRNYRTDAEGKLNFRLEQVILLLLIYICNF